MKPDTIIIRLGELTLKGRNRSRFERTVHNHIKRVMKPFPEVEYDYEYGRVNMRLNGTDYEQVAPGLARIFGIQTFSPVYSAELAMEPIEAMVEDVFRLSDPQPVTFKMNVRRANKQFPVDSQVMNRNLGGMLLKRHDGLRVDVHRPDLELRVELRENKAFIYTDVVEGAGGFPLGTNGKGMLMLSGGIDSPVAGWLAMRQGLEIEAVHFHSYPYTSERSQQKVADLAGKLAEYAGPVKLHMVPFTDIQTRLVQEYNGNLLITVMRRIMFRIAEQLAHRSGALAIVTGESLGQVASQTLPSLNAIGQAVSIPVLQPLIFREKAEIIKVAERIGTFPISILPHEDCCTVFLPPSPSTNPNLRIVEAIERKLEWLPELIEETVNRTEVVIAGDRKAKKFENYF